MVSQRWQRADAENNREITHGVYKLFWSEKFMGVLLMIHPKSKIMFIDLKPILILAKNKDRFVSVVIHKINVVRYIFFDHKDRQKVMCPVTIRENCVNNLQYRLQTLTVNF